MAALALKQLRAGNAAGPLLVFDNATGRTRDFDTRGSDAELLARVVEAFPAAVEADAGFIAALEADRASPLPLQEREAL